jgi:FMN phosphatase YigB (HAD superfamily)
MSLQPDKPAWESTLKSVDTEEFIDIHFYRPVGYRWALLFNRMGITPNQVTVAAVFIGIAAGICFSFSSFLINLVGVFLLIWANIYDSADGQLARMTGQKTELGRILDGACGDLWFITIYVAIAVRLWPIWGFWILPLTLVAAYYHSRQSAMADYYRNVYLLFLKGKNESEWDHSSDLRKKYAAIRWKEKPLVKLFEKIYLIYTEGQEKLTPRLQKMREKINDKYGGEAPEPFRKSFLKKTFPLLKYTNMLSFNLRSIVLFICVLFNFPWVYLVFEITVLNIMLVHMVSEHEKICSKNLISVKGVIFDYGGTVDTNGKHWAETLWDSYAAADVPVDRQQFKDAYVYGERVLATHPVIFPDDNFKTVLVKKTGLQLQWLKEKGWLPASYNSEEASLAVSDKCYTFVAAVLNKAKPVLDKLSAQYPLAVVSNFYGNMETVLEDFGIRHYFGTVVESSVVGIRKPDPALFALGVKRLGLKPEEVAVVGDSYKKDIFPAGQTGCLTIWLKGAGWDGDEQGTADFVIWDFAELGTLL